MNIADRPTDIDESIQKAVALSMTPKVVAWLGGEGCDDEQGIERVTRDLQEAFDRVLDWDAYAIARALDGAGWEVDSSLVSVLEEAQSHAYRETNKAVQEWVKANDIRPAFKVGDMVQTKSRRNGFEGEIIRVDVELGRYLVFNEAEGHVRKGPGTHGNYMDFEDAEQVQHAGGMSTTLAIGVVVALACLLAIACNDDDAAPVAASGAKQITVEAPKNQRGYTTEQENIARRIVVDNEPGAVKHLYVISAMSGQVLIYSTVKGKVTSSGKRITPTTVAASDGANVGSSHYGIPINIGGRKHYTSEVLQDDGSYGSSIEYLYWWDQRDRYHQHYVTGGQILHVSDAPLAVKSIVLNLEITSAGNPEGSPAPEAGVPK